MLESEIFPKPRKFLKAVCNLLVNESNMPGKLSHLLKHGKPKHRNAFEQPRMLDSLGRAGCGKFVKA